jgi:hypothetical protein
MRNLTQSLTLTSLATAVRGAFRLTDLFKGGQQGLLWLPESHRAALAGVAGATPTLFQDADGINAGAIEQPTGLVLDTRLGLPLGPERNPGLGFGAWIVLNGSWMLNSSSAIGNAAEGFIYLSGAQNDVYGYYEISGVVSNYAGGSIYVAVTNGEQTSRLIAANGAFTVRCYDHSGSPNSLIYIKGNGFTGSISNLSIREIRGNHAAQSTSAARPALTARVNLLTRTDDIGNSAWIKGNSTLGAGGLIYPASAGLFRGAYQSLSGLGTGAKRITFRLQRSGWRWVSILGSAGNANTGAYFDLQNGTIGTVYAGYTASIVAVDAVQGIYDCTISSQGEAISFAQFFLADANASNTATPSGTNGVIFHRASLSLGADAVPYQRVTTASDYDWQAGWLALNFDGLDDGITANFSAGTLGLAMDAWIVCSLAAGETSAVLVDDPTSAGARYFGVLESTQTIRQRADGLATASSSWSVNGALAGGTENPTRAELYAAVAGAGRVIVQASNLNLAAFAGARISNYAGSGGGFSFQGRHFAVLICPAQSAANRARIRRRLAQIFGIGGVV